ncbi:hypothetical protein M406DRAFT_69089 [Cryphonectria parasitica EP155]|uniref:MYND-type domain-containing protein n=1 Tax=Cryphonectria parasitica (strain ATCC 38755 / EP155) TaxID=660469 RepID=A0A9P4Y4R6_CRYP1|nr:uncharacterized protein M406DRAFT_69089 [Cryphonectria parasitica EP155]KAF3766912.1 hypothetical protein M406DRAFT_69089 [Cryphonectria parasitica EP155]
MANVFPVNFFSEGGLSPQEEDERKAIGYLAIEFGTNFAEQFRLPFVTDGESSDSNDSNPSNPSEAEEADDTPSSAYCPICLRTSELLDCQLCREIAYCSEECQRQDWPIHRTLCGQVPVYNATHRLGEHRRGIIFSADDDITGRPAESPHLIWVTQDELASFFPPTDEYEGADYDKKWMGRSQVVATQRLRVVFSSDPQEGRRNSCLANTIGDRFNILDWRGNVCVFGYSGDVTMRDFRAIVDFLQCWPHNFALVDPTRYSGPTIAGVWARAQPWVDGVVATERELAEMHMTTAMADKKVKLPLHILDEVLPIDALVSGTLPDLCLRARTSYHNHLLKIQISMRMNRQVELPVRGIMLGPIMYVRNDGRPLLQRHFEVLELFVMEKVRRLANTAGRSEAELWTLREERNPVAVRREDLLPELTVAEFRQFWTDYCRDNGLGEEEPCPVDL